LFRESCPRSFDDERSRFHNARVSVARREAIQTVAARALQGQRETDRVHVTKRVITVTTTNQAMMIAVIAVTREQKDTRSAINTCEA